MRAPTDMQTNPQGRAETLVEAHEKSDLAAKGIFVFFAFFFLAAVVVHSVVAWHLNGLRKEPAPTDQWPHLRQVVGTPATPTFPRLQITPPNDLAAFRNREEAELNTYGWVQKTAGVARVPISRAMDLLLQQGLPVRPATNENTTGKSSLQLQQQRPFQAQPPGARTQ